MPSAHQKLFLIKIEDFSYRRHHLVTFPTQHPIFIRSNSGNSPNWMFSFFRRPLRFSHRVSPTRQIDHRVVCNTMNTSTPRQLLTNTCEVHGWTWETIRRSWNLLRKNSSRRHSSLTFKSKETKCHLKGFKYPRNVPLVNSHHRPIMAGIQFSQGKLLYSFNHLSFSNFQPRISYAFNGRQVSGSGMLPNISFYFFS